MDIERTLETQRLRLLRVLAGLAVVLAFLSVGPVSRGFSLSVCGFVGSILSRIEIAARYMLITQAFLMISRKGLDIDRRRISEFLAPVSVSDDTDMSLPECRARLKALRDVLMDLPHHAMRLLRRIEKKLRRGERANESVPYPDLGLSIPLRGWQLAEIRIERPPDKNLFDLSFTLPPSGFRSGGVGGWPVAL